VQTSGSQWQYIQTDYTIKTGWLTTRPGSKYNARGAVIPARMAAPVFLCDSKPLQTKTGLEDTALSPHFIF